MSTKKYIIIGAVLVLVLVGAGAWLGLAVFGQSNVISASPYSVVYLSTGDIYFGNLSWFPSPRLTNVWFLARGVDQNNQPQTNIVPLKGAFWGPVDEVRLNPRQIIFWTHLRSDSQIVKVMENPALLQQTQTPQVPSSVPGGAPAQPTKK